MSTPEQKNEESSTRADASVWDIYYPKSVSGHKEVIYLASFPEIVYFWPTILVSMLCAFFQATDLLSQVGAGWLFCVVLVFNLVALVQDFDQKQFVILVLIFFSLVLGGWIVTLYGFSIFKTLGHWIASFSPAISTDGYLIIAGSMFLLFAWGIICPLFDYWRFEQNEFVHFTQPVGRDMSIARAGCTVYKEVPDIFECLLTFGGGTLVVKRENTVLASIKNVPFLSRRMRAIEHMLSETRVTVSRES